MKNSIEKAIVNCGVSKTKKVRKNTLHKGSTGLSCQRAGNKLEQQRCALGMINWYIGKYPADTNPQAIVCYLGNKSDRVTRLTMMRQLRTRYLAGIESVLSGKRYAKQ